MYSIILYLTAALILLPAMVLLSGRGAFLVSGYNTASPQKKAVYDEKKLCRVTGVCLLICGILLLIMAMLGEDAPSWFPAVFIIVILLDVIGTIWLANTRCFRDDTPPEITEAETKRSRRITRLVLMFTAAIGVLVCGFLFTGSIEPEFGEDSLLVRASYWPDLTIQYEDISSLELREEPVPGSRVGGLGSFRLLLGRFRSDELGHYTRYTYTGCNACVVLTARGNTIVLSGNDEAATRALYQELRRHTGLS